MDETSITDQLVALSKGLQQMNLAIRDMVEVQKRLLKTQEEYNEIWRDSLEQLLIGLEGIKK